MYKYIKPNNKSVAVIVLLSICSVLLLVNNQKQNRLLLDQQIVIHELEQTAQKAITDLADSNEHIRAYEIRISQLEEELAYYK